MRQQGVLLALDEAALRTVQAGVFGLANPVERLAQLADHVELVEQDRRLRSVTLGGVAERLPHVHDGQADALGLLFAEKRVELIQARFAAVAAAEPDRSMSLEIADHDPVGMPLANRNLVEADDLRAGVPARSSCSAM